MVPEQRPTPSRSELTPHPDERVWSGRRFTTDEMDAIRALIAKHPDATRAELARRVCALLDWRGADGRHRLMRCRVVMLRMAEAGLMTLPPPRSKRITVDPQAWHDDAPTAPTDPITAPVHELQDLKITIVRAADRLASRRWNAAIARYHYLGYQRAVGHQMRYQVSNAHQDLAMIGFASPAWKVAARDRWIGWSPQKRQQNLPLIVNNTRFLILPWVQAPNLASWILGQLARRLPQEWQQAYGIKPALLETFVDATRYTGHCYRAANWQCLGTTQGRGRYDIHRNYDTTVKSVWVYPLTKKPRQRLMAELMGGRAE